MTQPRWSGAALRGRHTLPAEVLPGQPGHPAAPGRENRSDCTSQSRPRSKPAAMGIDRQDLEAGREREETEEVTENPRGKPCLINRNCMNTPGKKDQNLQKSRTTKKEGTDQEQWHVLVPAPRYNTNTQCCPTSKVFSKILLFFKL